MLDRAKLSKQLEIAVRQSFDAIFHEIAIARAIWNKITEDKNFVAKVNNSQSDLNMPAWQANLDLDAKINLGADNDIPYTVISVDGSQIYPDRHRGTDCFLINISEVILHYGHSKSGAKLESFPYVYSLESEFNSEEFVNCKRQELELYHGVELAKKIRSRVDNFVLLLFDGSLIYWNLQSKDEKIKNHFFDKYNSILEQCFNEGIIIASYISLPKSKDLVSLLRFEVQDKNLFEFLTDADLVSFYLNDFDRSIVFSSNVQVVQDYSEGIKPYFFYLNTGSEIGRIEIPKYVAANEQMLQSLQKVIVDQLKKGNGYPVALSEAHEQAVVKNHEKELFYAMINSLNKNRGNLRISNKLSSKYFPAI